MNPPLKNVAESVRARLLNVRQSTGEDYNQLLVRFSIERLLYRLSQSSHRERFILKGAMLFTVWQGFPHRRTRDLDLLGTGDPAPGVVAAMFRDIIAEGNHQSDGVTFDASTVQAEEIRSHEEYVGTRVTLLSHIAAARIPLQIDVGYGDAVTPAPVEKTFPGLLDFPSPVLRCYAPETVIAEKLDAIVSLGIINTRLKDYFDLWFFSQQFDFDGATLADTIRATFARRGRPLHAVLPEGLTEAFWNDPSRRAAWQSFWKRSIVGLSFIPLEDLVRSIAAFLLPPANAAATGKAFAAQWKKGGPWTSQATD